MNTPQASNGESEFRPDLVMVSKSNNAWASSMTIPQTKLRKWEKKGEKESIFMSHRAGLWQEILSESPCQCPNTWPWECGVLARPSPNKCVVGPNHRFQGMKGPGLPSAFLSPKTNHIIYRTASPHAPTGLADIEFTAGRAASLPSPLTLYITPTYTIHWSLLLSEFLAKRLLPMDWE